jgi:hypothetical protein
MCLSPFFGEDITCFAQANYARVYGSKTGTWINIVYWLIVVNYSSN